MIRSCRPSCLESLQAVQYAHPRSPFPSRRNGGAGAGFDEGNSGARMSFDERVPDVLAKWQERWPTLPALWTLAWF